MSRLLLAAAALATAFTVAAGSRSAPAHRARQTPSVTPCVCKSEPDGGSRPVPHGLLMVADRDPALPCVQGG